MNLPIQVESNVEQAIPPRAQEAEASITENPESAASPATPEVLAPLAERPEADVVLTDVLQIKEEETAPKEVLPTDSQMRPSRRRKRGISLSEIDSEETQDQEVEFQDNPEKSEGKTIEKEALMLAWNSYAQKIQTQNKYSFHSTLVNRDPEILDDHTIAITLENEVQMEHLQAEKADLMSFIRENLDHPSIRLEAKIDIEDKSNIAYRTPREQYQDMMEKNPTLRKMSQQFDLDLEY